MQKNIALQFPQTNKGSSSLSLNDIILSNEIKELSLKPKRFNFCLPCYYFNEYKW